MQNGDLKWEKSSKELRERLYNELGMTKESVKRDVENLKLWLSKQPHLPQITDNNLLESFLFNCKNSLETAKNKMDQYYTVRATIPEYFDSRDPGDPKLQEHMYYAALPKLTKDNQRVLVVKLFNSDPDHFQPILVNKCALMLCDLLIRLDVNAGIQVVYDTVGLTLAHTAAVTIRITKNFIQCALSAYPQRVKGIHVINSSPVTIAFVNFNKMFLKEKTKNRIHVHGKGSTTLLDHINKEVLPEEYGGTFPYSMEQIRELTQKTLADHRKLFLEEENIKADLSKRPDDLNVQKALDEAQLFGAQGSFRHMHID